jgi:hypothetical protein
MDALVPFALTLLALFATVAATGGYESRDGFDRRDH